MKTLIAILPVLLTAAACSSAGEHAEVTPAVIVDTAIVTPESPMERPFTDGPSPIVIEPTRQMNEPITGNVNPSDNGAVDNNDPIVEKNPFPYE